MAYIEERKNKNGEVVSYKIIVLNGCFPDGRKKRECMTWKPEPGMNKTQIKKALRKAMVEFEERVLQGITARGIPTFHDYAVEVIEAKYMEYGKRKTVDRYKSLLPRIDAAIGKLKIDKVTPRHLNEFYKSLQKEGARNQLERAAAKIDIRSWMKEHNYSISQLSRESGVPATTLQNVLKRKNVLASTARSVSEVMRLPLTDVFELSKNNEPLSNNTILAYHRLISLVLSQAEKDLLVTHNAAKLSTHPKATKREAEFYEAKEIQELLLKVNENEPLKWRAILYLLIDTGCRRGEICGLKWKNVDFDTGLIYIRETLLYSVESGVYADTPKNHQSRTLKLSEPTLQLLKQLKEEQDKDRANAGELWIETGYVFTDSFGKYMHPDSVTSRVYKYQEKYGLFFHVHPHAFRHTAATMMLSNGIDVTTAARELGHKDPTTTMNIYSHVIDKNKALASEARGTLLLSSNDDTK